MNKSSASAASPDYVKFQAVIKSAASAASLWGGRASGRLDHGLKTHLKKFKKDAAGSIFAIFGSTSGQILKTMRVLAPLGLVTLVLGYVFIIWEIAYPVDHIIVPVQLDR